MKKFLRNFFILFVSVLILGKGIHLLSGMISTNKSSENESENIENSSGVSSFTFMGVGDNLIHEAIYYYWTDGNNYDAMYKPIKKYTKETDLSYINYETICAGEELELSGYPTFNGPLEINDAVSHAGFDWLSLCSNHAYDRGKDGIITSLDYIEKLNKKITVTGSYRSKKESNTPQVIEINGIKVGITSYTYGLNGFTLPEDEQWMINLIDKNQIKKDMKKLNEVSDVQIVSMHWGDEYQNTPSSFQKKYAKLLNECGVDVIIGTHPHVIQPVEWIHGDKQDTLCYYSLGNFISEQDEVERMIGGMARFTVEYDFNNEEVTIKEPSFTPTITYYNPNYSGATSYAMPEWNDELAEKTFFAARGDDISKEAVANYVKEVVGNPEGIEVVLK